MILSFILAQASGQQPGENSGVTISGEIIEAAMNGSDLMVKSFEKDWQDFAAGQSPIYLAIVSISMLAAVVLVSFWSLGWYAQFSEEGFSSSVVNEMIFPLIVILMLSNNGMMLAGSTLAMRNVTVNLNRSILSITRNGVTLKDAIRITNIDQSFVLVTQTALAQCDKLPSSKTDEQQKIIKPRQKCIDEVTNQAKIEAQKIRQKKGLGSGTGSWNPLDIGGELINNVVQGLSFIIFSGLSAGFQYIVQLSFLLTAYVAPIFLVLSLLPVGAKPIYAWLSGWLALTLVLISYSIIVGLAASAIVNVPSTNPLLTQLIQAIFSPLLALAIGAGGGMAVFTAFTSGVKFSVGFNR
ncbi:MULTISPECIES: hypothetical protein [Nostoc]|uniref:Uncharacterized protein n=1 Tax=Nostoc punctiforme FACHB-252 TaxID=1357509 RepID=A0ABR8HKP3_NOSPU|nr:MULTISPECIES: hypothetical protein [Nostoc]MBC1237342.1 hypothetical protein [Nostoc sp. 2RC]MBD2615946.1 hypothetical protein [Nostoc punctiforme FACHB-252]